MSFFYLGWLPAIITAAACTAFRIYEGGAGTVPGILAILCAMLIGLGWRQWRRESLAEAKWWEFYGLGLIINLVMVVIIAGLLPEIRKAFLVQIAPWVLLFYPLLFLALSLLMRHRLLLDLSQTDMERSRERYRKLFHHNQLPMFLIDPHNGSIVEANSAAEAFYGWSREELVQMRISDINTLPKAEVVSLMAKAKQGEVNEFEFIHRLRNGDRREVLVRSGPVEIDGRKLLYSSIADQTKSKRLMRDLRKSEAQAREFMSAVEQCRVSIVFTDLEGRIEYVNPYFCEMTGYSVQEVLGEHVSILSSGRQPKSFYRELWQTIEAGHTWEGEFCNRRKDGSEYWEYAAIAPVLNEAGVVQEYVAAKHDITAKKNMQRIWNWPCAPLKLAT